MKKIIFATIFALVLTSPFCGSVFASEINDEIINANVLEQEYDADNALEELSVIESNGLTATATRYNKDYMRVIFTNSTSSTITDTCNVSDALITGEHISGPFSISVPPNGKKQYDVYVGGNSSNYLITKNHGYFYFSL